MYLPTYKIIHNATLLASRLTFVSIQVQRGYIIPLYAYFIYFIKLYKLVVYLQFI